MKSTIQSLATGLAHDDEVPYFMWDYGHTVGQIREILASNDEQQRLWIMAKILRDARYADVWKFFSVKEFLAQRKNLAGRLGRQQPFWEFMHRRWVKQGFIPDAEHSHSAPAQVP